MLTVTALKRSPHKALLEVGRLEGYEFLASSYRLAVQSQSGFLSISLPNLCFFVFPDIFIYQTPADSLPFPD
jgi:hypothetical protein